MASFTVTVNNNVPPAITATMSGTVTYAQFKNSLGQFVYDVNDLYIFSSTQGQISQVYNYSKYDSSGTQNLQTVIPAIDPYQSEPSLFLNVQDKNLVIDGRDYVNTIMLPYSSLAMKLYVNKISSSDILDGIDENNFDKLENQSGDFGFFEDYTGFL